MNKKKLLFFIVIFLSGFLAHADDFDEFFDGPEGPPDDVSIQSPFIVMALLALIMLFIVLKFKKKHTSC